MSALETHTPTPWKLGRGKSGLSVSVVGADRRQVASSSWHDCSPHYPTQATTVANFEFIVEAVNSFASLKERVAELEKERNIQKAHSALRGRILQEIRDKIGPLLMGLEDEGDRIYLGSTNDKDWLTEVEETIFEVDDEVWETLNREEADPYRDLYDLRVNRLPALEAEIVAKDARVAGLEAENASLRLAISEADGELETYFEAMLNAFNAWNDEAPITDEMLRLGDLVGTGNHAGGGDETL